MDFVEAACFLGGQLFVYPQLKLTHYRNVAFRGFAEEETAVFRHDDVANQTEGIANSHFTQDA